jgi:two-component sensor histidine kinase
MPDGSGTQGNRKVRGAEAIAERPDGSRVPFIPYPTPLRDAAGNLVGAINMLVDITDRKEAENRQKLLIDELNHRVKNTLATVQSLARQTARHVEGLPDFIQTFEARILAIARAHDLLTKRHWQQAPLGALIQEVIAPMIDEKAERITVEGPLVALNARAALSITMSLNELATNAAKYGSLSAGKGSLAISWALRDEEGETFLDLQWEERGGPLVTPPTRRGFGTRLMERCVERDLDGEFDLVFAPEGVRCLMAIPTTRLGKRE